MAAEPVDSPYQNTREQEAPVSRFPAGRPEPPPTRWVFRSSVSLPSSQDRSFPLTDGLTEAGDRFSTPWEVLFFLESTDAGPVKKLV